MVTQPISSMKTHQSHGKNHADAFTWNYSLKPDLEAARKRLEAFWAGSSIGRPAIGMWVKKENFQADPFPPSCEGLGPKELDMLPEWHEWFTKFSVCGRHYLGEAMPGEHIGYGSWLAFSCLMSGGDYLYEKGHSAWIKKMPEVYSTSLPAFSPEHPAVKNMEISFQRAAQNLSGLGFICQPNLMDGLTLLSLYRGMDNLCLDMLDEPETVKKWNNAINIVNENFRNHWYQMTQNLGYGKINRCFWGPTSPGSCDFLQCDFAIMISPSDFNEFVMPGLERASEQLDYSLYHLDGMAQFRHINSLASLKKLNGIQVNPEPSKESPLLWLNEIREMRRLGLSVYVQCKSGDEAVEFTKEIGSDGVYIRIDSIQTIAEGESIIKRLEKVC